jgi:hypothetical protein
VEGDSGSWVVRDDRLCGYIFSRVVDSFWAYMLPIEPILEDIRQTLNMEPSTSLGISTSSETSPGATFSRQLPDISIRVPIEPAGAIPIVAPSVESSRGKQVDLGLKTEASGSRPQGEHLKLSYPKLGLNSHNFDVDDVYYDHSRLTCISDCKHETNIRDPIQHFLSCSRFSEKIEFYDSVPANWKQRIDDELDRIEKLRAVFERQDETKYMVRRLEMSLGRWLGGRERLFVDHRKRDPVDRANKASFSDRSDIGIKSNVVFLRNSYPYTNEDLGFEGQFPNQTVPLAALLDSSPKNPLTRGYESDVIRYFHFPANNMSWIEVGASSISVSHGFSDVDDKV